MHRSPTVQGAIALILAATVGLVSILGTLGCQRGNSDERGKGAMPMWARLAWRRPASGRAENR